MLLVVNNAEERIELTNETNKEDTIILSFPNFDSELRFTTNRKKEIHGFWFNYNKGANYKIPFFANFNPKQRKTEELSENLNGKWETHFSPETNDEEDALGIISQNKNHITGTFRTETGDYRFLEGYINGSKFYLSAFDGSHAFLLNGTVKDQKIQGLFYSGNHYSTNFIANYNPDYKLRDPDSITILKKNAQDFSFDLKTIDGKDYHFPNEDTKGKVVIIQIMGTWCPNCMDETNYYKELFDKYHSKGLEIISIGYEATDSFENQVKKILTLKQRKNLDFTFLVGGKASKEIASEHFSMLNEVISFPTSIYIGRDGEVKRIHTGFNGPGTGEVYLEYVKKTNALIESLLGIQ
ncbi:TlpA disulfide reductase family protein [Fluviicola sp.]|uniref:peroxiredoxin family protein n=1 Tax=Fluviicola sp. TaxID=1917219 RepID=UPI00281AC29C|nr:TlpA disulfide reductase family protein [Fluviicola sp.]MDR0802239.1 TlpA family protein disulfide reductase [Fluviicola sp.]